MQAQQPEVWGNLVPAVRAGTVAYAAPECLDPSLSLLSPKADVNSLGLVLWEMLAGERPCAGLRSHESCMRWCCRASGHQYLKQWETQDLGTAPHGSLQLLYGCLRAVGRLSLAGGSARMRWLGSAGGC
jgi:serine/threonine protein kinase